MSYSYSKVKTFKDCPYKYYLKYIKNLKPRPSVDPSSPLFLGTACHTGIETRSVEKAIEEYKSNYKFINPLHEAEMVKLRKVLEKAIVQIPEGEYEYKIADEDGFVGYIDCLVPVGEDTYDILDFKYSNNQSKYKRSGQIHIYKYYFEKLTGKKIRNIYYVFIPKLRNPDDEVPDIDMVPIKYNPQQITMFQMSKEEMDKATVFEKCPNHYCSSCDYCRFCSSNGEDMTGLITEPEQVSLFG